MRKENTDLASPPLENTEPSTEATANKDIPDVLSEGARKGISPDFSKRKIDDGAVPTFSATASSEGETSSKTKPQKAPSSQKKSPQNASGKSATSGEKKAVLGKVTTKGKLTSAAKLATKEASVAKGVSASMGMAPPKEATVSPKEGKTPPKENAFVPPKPEAVPTSKISVSEIKPNVSTLVEKKNDVSPAASKAKETSVTPPPATPPTMPSEFLDPDHEAKVRAARLRLKALYREEEAQARKEEEQRNLYGFRKEEGFTLNREEPSLLGRGLEENSKGISSKENPSYSSRASSPYVDSASYGEERHRSLFSRIKDAILTRITRIQGIYVERAKRGELSQAAGQAEERSHQRKNLAIVLILVGVISGSLVFLGNKTRPARKPEVKILKNDFKLSPDSLEKQSFQRQYGERLEAMDANMKSLQATLEQLDARLKREQEKAKLKGKAAVTGAPNVNADPSLYVNPTFGKETQKKEKPRMARLTVSATSASTSKGKAEKSSLTTARFATEAHGVGPSLLRDEPLSPNRARGQASYLPAGSFAAAVVLSGVTAPTGAGATSNPVPMLLELTDLAQLPNDFKAKVNRCFVTANATGDLSSERVWIRLDRLSCMRQDARAIDVKVRGYVTGEDGKTGVRARVVTRSGQAIANALLLGSISGFGSALSASATQSTTYTSGSVGTVVNNPWRAGAGEAVKDATDRLVDYYIKLADKIFPVLELDSGRRVDVVLSQGVSLGEGRTVEPDPANDKPSTPEEQINSARTFGESLRGRRSHSHID